MPDALTCTSCRSPIAVPADHAADTIRCGICWTEVAVPKVPVIKPAAAAPAAKPKSGATAGPGSGVTKGSGVQVAAALPPGAKPAAGMARLEALLHSAGGRLRPPAAPAKA